MAVHTEQTPLMVYVLTELMMVHQIYRLWHRTTYPRGAVAHVIIMFKKSYIVGAHPGAVVAVETLLNGYGSRKGMGLRVAPFSPQIRVTPPVDPVICVGDMAGTASHAPIKSLSLWRKLAQVTAEAPPLQEVIDQIRRSLWLFLASRQRFQERML